VKNRFAVDALNYLTFQRTANSIPQLDGLRAVAILLVLATHAIKPVMKDHNVLLMVGSWDLSTPMLNGWIGVDLFFVLSGFLIGSHLIRSPISGLDKNLWHYFLQRILRIVPAYYFVLLVTVFGLVPMYEVNQDIIGIRVFYHLLFLQDFLPSNIVASFWSLGVEEKFYIIAPFIVLSISRLNKLCHRYTVLIILMLLPTIFRYFTLSNYDGELVYETFFLFYRSPFHVSFDALIAGLICAHLYQDSRAGRVKVPAGLPGKMLLIGVISIALHWIPFVMMDRITAYDKTIQQLVIGISFSFILFGLIDSEGKHTILRSKAGLFLARISYTLYLCHMLFIDWCYANYYPEDGGSLWHFGLYIGVFLLISILVACVLHYMVEKPFLILKDTVRRSKNVSVRDAAPNQA